MTEGNAELITVTVATVGMATGDNLTSSGKVLFTYRVNYPQKGGFFLSISDFDSDKDEDPV